jgi:hypothetical protein
MYKWIGTIIMTAIKELTIKKVVELIAVGDIVSKVINEAADRAENVAGFLERIEEGIKENE